MLKMAWNTLSKKDRTVLVSAVVIAFIMVCALFNTAKAGTGGISFNTSYPVGNLAQVGDLQKNQYRQIDGLDKVVQFPGTDYVVSVGGNELYSDESGTVFQYSEDVKFVVSMEDSYITTEGHIKNDYGTYISAGEHTASKYTVKNSSEGYVNGLFMKYEAGLIVVDGRGYVVLTYRYELANGKSIFLSALTDNEAVLQNMRDTLRNMVYTLAVVDDSQGMEPAIEEETYQGDNSSVLPTKTKYNDSAKIDGGSGADAADPSVVSSKNDGSKGTAHASTLKEPTYHVQNRFKTQVEGPIDEGDASDIGLYEKFEVDKELSKGRTVLYVRYTMTSFVPSYVNIYDPHGEVWEATYYNNENDGFIYVDVDNPLEGEWAISMGGGNIGPYTCGVVTYEDFLQIRR